MADFILLLLRMTSIGCGAAIVFAIFLSRIRERRRAKSQAQPNRPEKAFEDSHMRLGCIGEIVLLIPGLLMIVVPTVWPGVFDDYFADFVKFVSTRNIF